MLGRALTKFFYDGGGRLFETIEAVFSV